MPQLRPEPPALPACLTNGVGPGEFWEVGRNTVDLVRHYACLHDAERVLDVGCGMGRIAWPLAQQLDARSTYDGFDAAAEYVASCSTLLGLDPKRFHFHHFDIRSSLYNPGGAVRPEDFRFPWPDGAFTLAIATSLFTHLPQEATRHYMQELGRTIAPGGRLYATVFVYDEQAQRLMDERGTTPGFTTRFEHGMLADPERPEVAVAYDGPWLHQVLIDAGFKVMTYQPGCWRQTWGPEYQDLVVARRV